MVGKYSNGGGSLAVYRHEGVAPRAFHGHDRVSTIHESAGAAHVPGETPEGQKEAVKPGLHRLEGWLGLSEASS